MCLAQYGACRADRKAQHDRGPAPRPASLSTPASSGRETFQRMKRLPRDPEHLILSSSRTNNSRSHQRSRCWRKWYPGLYDWPHAHAVRIIATRTRGKDEPRRETLRAGILWGSRTQLPYRHVAITPFTIPHDAVRSRRLHLQDRWHQDRTVPIWAINNAESVKQPSLRGLATA